MFEGAAREPPPFADGGEERLAVAECFGNVRPAAEVDPLEGSRGASATAPR
jgi:hypothetical protein